jgi:hypothetical protein
MLAGKAVSKSSNDAVGTTFESERYEIVVRSYLIRAYDTTGLNESGNGTVPSLKAIALLFKLIRSLADEDGIDFLVFVTRPRINENTQRNYAMFFKTLCREKVPIVIVVTGLEHEATMDDWWEGNNERFRSHGMTFQGHACVTTTKGKRTLSGYSLQSEYDQSKKTLDHLISSLCKEDQPWRQDADVWFSYALENLLTHLTSFFDLSKAPREKEIKRAFIDHAGLTKYQAGFIAKRIMGCLKKLKS